MFFIQLITFQVKKVMLVYPQKSNSKSSIWFLEKKILICFPYSSSIAIQNRIQYLHVSFIILLMLKIYMNEEF